MDVARTVFYFEWDLTGQSGNVYITPLWPTYTLIDLHHFYSNIKQISNLELAYAEAKMIKKKDRRPCSINWNAWIISHRESTPPHLQDANKMFSPDFVREGLPIQLQVARFRVHDWRTACCTHWAVLLLPLQRVVAEEGASSSISLMSRYTESAFSTQPSGRIFLPFLPLSPLFSWSSVNLSNTCSSKHHIWED